MDLDYPEDSTAEADANFILTADGGIIEIQATAEDGVMQYDDFQAMFKLAQKGVAELTQMQNQSLQG